MLKLRSSHTSQPNDSGYTLVEVLVTLAIVALALGPLLSVFSDGFRRAGHSQAMARATLHARSLLDRAGIDTPLREGLTTGQLENGFRWRLRIEPFGEGTDSRAWPIGAFTVLVEVLWHDGNQERSVTVATLRLGPREPSQ